MWCFLTWLVVVVSVLPFSLLSFWIPSIFLKGLLQTVEEPFLLPAGHLAEVIYHAILGTHKTGSEGGGGDKDDD